MSLLSGSSRSGSSYAACSDFARDYITVRNSILAPMIAEGAAFSGRIYTLCDGETDVQLV